MERFQPYMSTQKPDGWFEKTLHYGQKLPGKLGLFVFVNLSGDTGSEMHMCGKRL